MFWGRHITPASAEILNLYTVPTLRKVAAAIRKSKASIVLTHSPVDYMEDHTNTCRLAVAAAFTHGMPNFRTTPVTRPYGDDVTVYHAMPHSLRGPLREKIVPGAFVDTTVVHERKIEALAAHAESTGLAGCESGMNSYLKTADDMSRHVGKLSKNLSTPKVGGATRITDSAAKNWIRWRKS